MAYNEKLANMTRELLAETHKNVIEKAMFGGLCFMVNDKMALGVEKERLMVRLDPAIYDEVMEKEGCRQMDFSGKPMKGFVFVDADVLNTKKKLEYWVKLALDYNKIAKSSKKSTKSAVNKNKTGK
jgi:TfoX/Sxy family transcriptional regulator of competence genes